jgi:hypothetical protein
MRWERPVLKKLSDLFEVTYGNKLDLNKMQIDTAANAINFVGRSSQNHGVSARVSPIDGIKPFEEGLITVALGGTKLLASFVQMSPFYTAQNVAVLKSWQPMSFAEKLFMCLAIRHNRFRYSAFGREANRTIRSLLVPDPSEFPKWIKSGTAVVSVSGLEAPAEPNPSLKLNTQDWQPFIYDKLFTIDRGRGPRRKDLDGAGLTPFITSIDSNNGVTGYTTMMPTHQGNTITVNRNGSVGEAYYQSEAFCSTEDVHVFTPMFPMNKYIALFLVTLIRQEKYRFSYGRKWGLERMNKSMMRLPATSSGEPDWKFMEGYIKSLPYSTSI